MVRHYEHGLAAKAEPFAFHRSSCHLEGLSCSYHMCKQSVSTIYDASCCIPLMLSERDLRIHPGEYYVASVIFSWSDRVEFFIVDPCQPFPSFGVFPYPAFEGVLYGLLLSLSDGCLLFIEHCFLPALIIFDIVKDADVSEIQGLLYDLVCIHPAAAIGAARPDIAPVVALSFDVPLSCMGRIPHIDLPPHIGRRAQKLEHEIRYHIRRQPRCSKPHTDLARRKFLRLHLFEEIPVHQESRIFL